jgi:hypothetical protein
MEKGRDEQREDARWAREGERALCHRELIGKLIKSWILQGSLSPQSKKTDLNQQPRR